MSIYVTRTRLLLLAGAAALPLMMSDPARAETICSQAADGTVTCTDDGVVVATGMMTPGTVVAGPGLVAESAGELEGSMTGSIVTESGGAEGVSLGSSDLVTFELDGAVSTDGDDAAGVFVRARRERWSGTVLSAITVDDVSTAGANSAGIDVEAVAGAQVSCGNVTTSGAGSDGVTLVVTVEGPANLSCGNVIATGTGSEGVGVSSYSGGRVIVGDIVSGGTGLSARTSEGGMSITAGDITTTGDEADGADLYGGDSVISLTCGNIHTTGNGSSGLITGAGSDGGASVTCGNIITEGDNSSGASLNQTRFQLGDITTLGDNSGALFARDSFGTVGSIGTVGNISTSGDNSTGITFRAGTGGVTAGNIVTTGAGSTGLFVDATWTGGSDRPFTFILGDVTTSGAGSAGIAVQLEEDFFGVVIEAGDVATGGDDAPAISIVADGQVTLTAGDVSTLGANSGAVFVDAGKDATVTVGNVSTAGPGSMGINVDAGADSLFDEPLGTVNLTCGSVTTTGADSTAIRATSNHTVNVTCGDISATGASSDGVLVFAEYGDLLLEDVVANRTGISVGTLDFGGIRVTVDDVLITGDGGAGIWASSHDGGIAITCGSVTTLGNNSFGLDTNTSDGAVSVTCGDIRTEGDGSDAANLYGTFFELGDLTTLGDDADGLVVNSQYGSSGTVGNISTSGANAAGIISFDEFANITAGDISTTGDGSEGVFVGYGGAALELGQVTTSGADAHGISVDPLDFWGSVSLSVAGVHVSGAGADAIRLLPYDVEFDSGGNVTDLTFTGDIISEQGRAIVISTGNDFDLAVAEGQQVSGGTGGILVHSTETTLDIAGAVRATEGPAIEALGGPATVTIASTGTVEGFLTFGGGADEVTSAGVVTIRGTSDFGAGSDLFTNNNLLVVSGEAAFVNLEQFQNNGTIDMQDGAPGDRLEFGGDYSAGADASVLLDVSRSLDSADVLAFGGDVSGQTLIDINWVDSNAPVNAGGLVLIEGTTDASPFAIQGLDDFGLFELVLQERDGDLWLMAAFDPAATDLVLLTAVAPDMWYQSFDAVRASVAGRGSFLPRLGFWAQAYGSRDRSGEGNRTVELFDVEVPVSSRLDTDRLGGQVGFDASIGAVLVGATAGYAKADADAGAASDIDSDAFNLGAYAAVGAAVGPYAVLTVKHDWIDVDFENPGLAVPGLDATSLGGDVEVGWRGTLLAASVDFNAGLSIVRSDLDGFEIDTTSFETGSATSMRGRAGGRVTLNAPLRPFAEARVFHEFGEDGALRIISGNLDDELEGERGTWARLEAGIGGGNDRALLSLWGDFGDREGFGVRAGLKF